MRQARRQGGIVAAAIGTTLSMLLAAPAFSADYVMKLSTPTINDMQHEWMQMYEKELEARTNGRIDVQLYPASQLGPINNVMEGMQLGTIEATITPFEFYVGVDPRFQVPAVPGLFDSMQDARTKLDDPKVREHLLNLAADKGIVGISIAVYGPQMIATRNKVNTLADLSGQRIRVLASETEIGTINALGASAVPMPLNEVSAALQQGAIDGVSTVLDVFVSLRTNEVAPNVTKTELWYLVSLASVSKAWLDSLPEDLQKIVIETGKDIEHPMFERQLERDKANKETWTKNGGTFTELNEADRTKANEAAAGVAKAFLDAHPEMKETYDLINNAGTN
ncbi:TRAP transporter substrate-binding protein [Rhodoligotrophos defluvii]|uniref:TRAP transporter substrate-binding protein n=1 Tax=Rhodoligotrophos defluvii TaxID=2561934 RepID=UPI0010CA13B8|nr:TRAP transporter substrate-binding protein [Rhodoligotrophos defluvii]